MRSGPGTLSCMDGTRPGHAALRNGRWSLPGQAYLLTFTTRGRRPLFRDLWVARAAIAGLLHPPVWKHARLWCWVLMPDHAHLLVQLDASHGGLGTLVRNAKASATRRVRVLIGTSAVWDRAYHDRAVRRDEDLRAVARYVIANPLRAGLVQRIADYPLWDAAWLAPGIEGAPIL